MLVLDRGMAGTAKRRLKPRVISQAALFVVAQKRRTSRLI
jgi:hypothetical protein